MRLKRASQTFLRQNLISAPKNLKRFIKKLDKRSIYNIMIFPCCCFAPRSHFFRQNDDTCDKNLKLLFNPVAFSTVFSTLIKTYS